MFFILTETTRSPNHEQYMIPSEESSDKQSINKHAMLLCVIELGHISSDVSSVIPLIIEGFDFNKIWWYDVCCHANIGVFKCGIQTYMQKDSESQNVLLYFFDLENANSCSLSYGITDVHASECYDSKLLSIYTK